MEKEDRGLARSVRLCVWLLAAMFVVLCAVTVAVVPKALRTLDHIDQTLTSLDTLSETAGDALTAANSAAENANRLVSDNADAVAEAMEKFNSVDFDALNKAINDLADIVEPLARVSNFFSR